MDNPARRWLRVSLFNLFLVACLGVLLRYKIAYYLPMVQQKFVLHSHSHFAFSGWITQSLMVLLIHHLGNQSGKEVFKKYNWLLYANLLTAYGMLISFIFQGYAAISIIFSTLSIFVSYIFAVYYWKDLTALKQKKVSNWWMKASLIFSVISSIGAFGLAFMMANKITSQNLYLAAIYFFLHFQYNGWFLFAGMGLLASRLETFGASFKKLKQSFLLFCLACVPAYLLSALWLPIPLAIYILVVASVFAQLIGWWILVKEIQNLRVIFASAISKFGKNILLLASIAFTIKLLLQTGSVIPSLSKLSYGFHPIIIGYLHLVLLAVTSLFIIGYIISFQLIPLNKRLINGVIVFVSGIILNELLLMIEGIFDFSYNPVPYINQLLLIAALVLLLGAFMIFTGFRKKVIPD
ncbi:hypothetical protein BH11BAC3_BH11BAC3_39150 [soil metagenome]